jgi:hypothetical protein
MLLALVLVVPQLITNELVCSSSKACGRFT